MRTEKESFTFSMLYSTFCDKGNFHATLNETVLTNEVPT